MKGGDGVRVLHGRSQLDQEKTKPRPCSHDAKKALLVPRLFPEYSSGIRRFVIEPTLDSLPLNIIRTYDATLDTYSNKMLFTVHQCQRTMYLLSSLRLRVTEVTCCYDTNHTTVCFRCGCVLPTVPDGCYVPQEWLFSR